jgi:hypothetical protein
VRQHGRCDFFPISIFHQTHSCGDFISSLEYPQFDNPTLPCYTDRIIMTFTAALGSLQGYNLPVLPNPCISTGHFVFLFKLDPI